MTTGKPVISLDIGPLSERAHTGIANVAKFLAIELLNDTDVDCAFTFNRQFIHRHIVEKLVAMTGGDILWWIAGRTISAQAPEGLLERPAIAIYPGHKWHRRLFPFEVQIVHDLTTILMPEYHEREAVSFWQKSLFGDMASSDLIVAVSESTAIDVRTYYPELSDVPLIVSHLAPCCQDAHLDRVDTPPYVVVLGTLEPRKNVLPILEYIAANRNIVDRISFVFVGRIGWGPSVEHHLERLRLRELISEAKIRFTGYVGDRVRDTLVANSRGVIYPSLYEGFGLPVLEALALGVPVITTESSSLPEVGGSMASYCDFSNPRDIAMHIESLLESTGPRETPGAMERRAWARTFSWNATYRRIRDASLTEYDRKFPNSAPPASVIETRKI